MISISESLLTEETHEMSRIGLIGENSIEYIEIILNIWKNQNCVVLVDWRIPFFNIINMLNEAGVDECYIV